MKCQKCDHIGFDHLSQCTKCGADLTQTRQLLGFSSLASNVPFLLGSLLGKADKEQNKSTGVLLQKDTREDSDGIHMLEGFELSDDLDQKELDVQILEDSEGELPLIPSVASDDEGTISMTSPLQGEDFGLSLSFDDSDELVLEPEFILQEDPLLPVVELQEKDREDLGDMDELTLEDFVEHFSLETPEPPKASSRKTSRAKKPAKGAKDTKVPDIPDIPDVHDVMADDLTLTSIDPEVEVLLDDPSLEEGILEFELEEIDFDALTLEVEEPSSEAHQESGADSQKSSQAGASKKNDP